MIFYKKLKMKKWVAYDQKGPTICRPFHNVPIV